jgi:hypothetical protein
MSDPPLRGNSPRNSSVELACRAEQASTLKHWLVAIECDVGTVIASVKSAGNGRKDLPHDVTFAFVVRPFHPEIAILEDSGSQPPLH